MKHLFILFALISSSAALAGDQFSCFTTYTRPGLGVVEEQVFVVTQLDPILKTDGYLTSVNTDQLLNNEKEVSAEFQFGVGTFNKGKVFHLTFKPYYVTNKKTEEKRLVRIGVIANDVNVIVSLHSEAATTIEVPVRFGKEALTVHLECGLFKL